MNLLFLDHIGLLVNSATKSAEHFKSRKLEVGNPEDFISEGTREIYVGGDSQDGKVLLLEAIGQGPYLSAMKRRGPGLHHVGLRVSDMRAFVGGLSGSGWLLHPTSLSTYVESETIWLARPGTPVLIELISSSKTASQDTLVTSMGLPISPKLIEALSCSAIEGSKVPTVNVGEWSFHPSEVCE